jgi:hypothetical protein
MREQVLDLKFISIDYYISGNSILRFQERDSCSCCIKQRKGAVQKKAKEIISHIPKDFTIADALVRRRNGRGSLENYCCL